MDIHSASQARANLFKLLEQVNQESKPCIITSRKGDGVLISKDDWENIQETLYLQSIPGMQQSIIEGMTTPLSECVSEDKLEW
jgi:prevent-host-death family protein